MRSRIPLLAFLLALLAAAPARLAAQRIVSMPVGAQVRVASQPYTGSAYAAAASADTLTLIVDRKSAPLRVPMPTITSLSVRLPNEPRRMALKGAFFGLLAGTAVWGLSHLWWNYNELYSYNSGYTPLSSEGAFLLFGGGGAALGAAWGYFRPGSHWTSATPPVRLLVYTP